MWRKKIHEIANCRCLVNPTLFASHLTSLSLLLLLPTKVVEGLSRTFQLVPEASTVWISIFPFFSLRLPLSLSPSL